MPATLLQPPPENETKRPRRRAGIAALLAVAVLAGGLASTAVLVLTGAVGGSGGGAPDTIVRSAGSSPAGLDARAVYADASPGVVNITATGVSSDQPGPFGGGPSQSSATGSGYVVDANGHIVTAAHVVDGASAIKVTFANGTTRTATLSGKDEATDVAVLKVNPSGLNLHPLKLGSSASLKSGDPVAAIGSPFGYEESVSTGIVSGVDRTIDAPNGFTVAHAIQTDAALNPGNSGGPILDSSGRVVGIADQIATGGSNSEQGSGVGFAVPSSVVSAELAKLESGQSVRHAFLGVSTTESVGGTAGALVASVKSGSPADSAGIRGGDVITNVDGKAVHGSGDLVAAIAAREPGESVRLTVRRGSDTHTLSARLATQPATRTSG
jgi:putative serine protease PepD